MISLGGVRLDYVEFYVNGRCVGRSGCSVKPGDHVRVDVVVSSSGGVHRIGLRVDDRELAEAVIDRQGAWVARFMWVEGQTKPATYNVYIYIDGDLVETMRGAYRILGGSGPPGAGPVARPVSGGGLDRHRWIAIPVVALIAVGALAFMRGRGRR